MKRVRFTIIRVDTPAYEEMVALRMKVLLGPIGIPATYINSQKEAGDILIGAVDEAQLVGCCILTRINSQTVQLRQMAIDQSLQQKGIGRDLIAFAEHTASDNGYHTVMLHARDTVIPFYEKCGYAIAGEQFFEVGIGHHKMDKKIGCHR